MRKTEEASERIRTCLGCRQQLPQGEFLRIVRGPTGDLVPDLKKRLPGRGGYVCYDLHCLQKALDPARLRRAFREENFQTAPVGAFIEQLILQLKESMKNLLCIVCKARKAVLGRVEVREAIEDGRLRLIAVASDCEESRRQEMTNRCEVRSIPQLNALPLTDLGQISGRGAMDFVGVTHRGFADELLVLRDRLRRFQPSEGMVGSPPVSIGRRENRS